MHIVGVYLMEITHKLTDLVIPLIVPVYIYDM